MQAYLRRGLQLLDPAVRSASGLFKQAHRGFEHKKRRDEKLSRLTCRTSQDEKCFAVLLKSHAGRLTLQPH